MAGKLIRLEEDGPLGPAGTQVWVDDDAEPAQKPTPRKSTHTPKKSAK